MQIDYDRREIGNRRSSKYFRLISILLPGEAENNCARVLNFPTTITCSKAKVLATASRYTPRCRRDNACINNAVLIIKNAVGDLQIKSFFSTSIVQYSCNPVAINLCSSYLYP